jgi:hypothetical protein
VPAVCHVTSSLLAVDPPCTFANPRHLAFGAREGPFLAPNARWSRSLLSAADPPLPLASPSPCSPKSPPTTHSGVQRRRHRVRGFRRQLPPRRHPLLLRQLLPCRHLPSGQRSAGSARACIRRHRSSPTRPKHDTPGDVLDDFSLADSFIAQPPPSISASTTKRAKATAPSAHQKSTKVGKTPASNAAATSVSTQSTIPAAPCAHILFTAPVSSPKLRRRAHPYLLAACIWFWAIYQAWIATRCSGIAAHCSAAAAAARPWSCRLSSHQHPLDLYHLGNHTNGSAPPFSSRTVFIEAHASLDSQCADTKHKHTSSRRPHHRATRQQQRRHR